MPTPKQMAAKFSAIDAHDDTFERFVIFPPTGRRRETAVEVTLFRHWTNKRRIIRFTGCANVNVSLDADVVGGNWPINTHVLDATTDQAAIASLMRRHKRSWHVRFEKSSDPFPAKLVAAKRRVLFRVRMFGGLLEIVARSFSIKRVSNAQ